MVLALGLLNMGSRETLKRAESKALSTVTETTCRAQLRPGDQAQGSDKRGQWEQEEEAESSGGL